MIFGTRETALPEKSLQRSHFVKGLKRSMFNSRDPAYKDPTGAVAEGTSVHFRITLPRELTCSASRMVIEQEGVGTQILDLFWCGMNGDDWEWWECHFTPPAPGLYFYHFEARTLRGARRLSRGFAGSAVFNGFDRWQLTVYSKNLSVPEWPEGGIMYQIFPDRFAASGIKKENVPEDRTLRQDWGGEPEWRPDAQGRVTNSDYFGGDLKGIEEKLPYLKKLGVTCIYCNPLFEAHSNHRYNTADYSKIDPLLGTERDFSDLCAAAEKLGIRVIIDGVFNHTGSDSVYFNREGRYPTLGAHNSQQSPYYSWFSFRQWPNSYDCWWNFDTLPNVNEGNRDYQEYITGKDGIVRKWLRAGAAGWRLDVVDELPDNFIDLIAAASVDEKPDAYLLGEVWEDASNKAAYGVRRRYLLGGQLDSVMNYPFRDAILNFLLGADSGSDPKEFAETVESILENYPPQAARLLMNHIGTHDTERALTVLGGEPAGNRGREWQSAQKMTPEQRETGKKRLKLASLIQYFLPGIPCLYYGDEAGLEGYRDPFNRRCYPWGNEDRELLDWYETLGRIRTEHKHILARGGYKTLLADKNLLAFERFTVTENVRDSLVVVVNRSSRPQSVFGGGLALSDGQLLLGEHLDTVNVLSPFGYCLLRFRRPLPPPADRPEQPSES